MKLDENSWKWARPITETRFSLKRFLYFDLYWNYIDNMWRDRLDPTVGSRWNDDNEAKWVKWANDAHLAQMAQLAQVTQMIWTPIGFLLISCEEIGPIRRSDLDENDENDAKCVEWPNEAHLAQVTQMILIRIWII